jgi:hypothetical protein
MTEQEKWDLGVAAVVREYKTLSPALKSEVGRCAAAIKSCKTKIHLIAEEAGSAEICALCNGECCKSGNNHFRGVELIVYLSDGRELFTPCFGGEICSYLGESGCLMEPEYRPYNCITFICERVEERLHLEEKERYYAMALDLRALYGELEQLLGRRFNSSLLSACERQLPGAGKRRLGKSPGCGEVL